MESHRLSRSTPQVDGSSIIESLRNEPASSPEEQHLSPQEELEYLRKVVAEQQRRSNEEKQYYSLVVKRLQDQLIKAEKEKSAVAGRASINEKVLDLLLLEDSDLRDAAVHSPTQRPASASSPSRKGSRVSTISTPEFTSHHSPRSFALNGLVQCRFKEILEEKTLRGSPGSSAANASLPSCAPKTRNWLLKIMSEIYQNVIFVSSQKPLSALPQDCAALVFQYIQRKWGMKKLVDKTAWELYNTLCAHRGEDREVEMFCGCLDGVYRTEDFIMMAHTRSQILLKMTGCATPQGPVVDPEMQGISMHELVLPQNVWESISHLLFGRQASSGNPSFHSRVLARGASSDNSTDVFILASEFLELAILERRRLSEDNSPTREDETLTPRSPSGRQRTMSLGSRSPTKGPFRTNSPRAGPGSPRISRPFISLDYQERNQTNDEKMKDLEDRIIRMVDRNTEDESLIMAMVEMQRNLTKFLDQVRTKVATHGHRGLLDVDYVTHDWPAMWSRISHAGVDESTIGSSALRTLQKQMKASELAMADVIDKLRAAPPSSS